MGSLRIGMDIFEVRCNWFKKFMSAHVLEVVLYIKWIFGLFNRHFKTENT